MTDDSKPDKTSKGEQHPGNLSVQSVTKASAELVDDTKEMPSTRKKYNDALLLHLDDFFRPLMTKARTAPSTPYPQPEDKKPPMLAHSKGSSSADLAALQEFRQRSARPVVLPHLMHTVGGKRSGPESKTRPRPSPGLGPPLHVGIDAEWVRKSKGRNTIISVQFFVVGPTGKRYTKIIHLTGAKSVDKRPSLAEALDKLLDECEVRCIFDEWPCEVVLVGFFNRGDITAFSDFRKFRHLLDGIGGSLVTVSQPAKIELPMKPKSAERLKFRYTRVLGNAFNPVLMSIRLVDALLLAPPASSLKKIGAWLNIEKLPLPEGFDKSDMERFRRERPQAFDDYALRDAEIAVYYALWVFWFCDRHLGLKGLSSTASGLAVRVAEMCIRKDGVDPDIGMNFVNISHTLWREKVNRPVTVKKRLPVQIRTWFEPFLADAYQGGRNECFWFGPTPVGTYFDPDLSGAYVAGLAYVMALDYDRLEMTKDVKHFVGHVAGFASVRFKFPDGTRFPCLPVAVKNRGLWFPLSGESLCTAPEIELALSMGAHVEVLFGIVIPWMARDDVFNRSQQAQAKKRAKAAKPKSEVAILLEAAQGGLEGAEDVFIPVEEMQFPPPDHGDEGYRLFESFAIYVRKMRSRYARKSLPFEFVKLIGNAAYGKTGQGFKSKRTFNPKDLDSVAVGQSRISEPAVAGLVCGFIRAVLGEILWKLPADARAVSVTTDGMLVDVPLESMDLSGEMCRRFQALVDRIAPGTAMLELKHQVKQVFAIRTRGQLTGEVDGENDIIVAKAGVKPVLHGDENERKKQMEPAAQNAYMLDLVVNRFAGQKLPRDSMMSMREQLLNGYDLQMQTNDVKLNLEFDFKRQPINPVMITIQNMGVEHIAMDTVPWATSDEGELTRTVFDQWRKVRVMKTLDDERNWQGFMGFYMANKRRVGESDKQLMLTYCGDSHSAAQSSPIDTKAERGSTGRVYATGKTGYVGVALRTFLTAYAKKEWGLKDADLSQAWLAGWLTEQGYPVKTHTIKNAGRSKLNEKVVPPEPDVVILLNLLKGRFPALEVERFLF
jgi:hypothetical protein